MSECVRGCSLDLVNTGRKDRHVLNVWLTDDAECHQMGRVVYFTGLGWIAQSRDGRCQGVSLYRHVAAASLVV